MTTVAAIDSMPDRRSQTLYPTMYERTTGSGVIFRKQIRVSPRRLESAYALRIRRPIQNP